jgi:transposase
MVERARMILLASDGLSGKEIALKMGTREARVSKWLRRFALESIAGLNDSARSAEKRRKYTSVTEKRILQALDEPVPAGYSRWNGRLLAEHLGNVSKDQVWRVMRKHDPHLERRQSWCVSIIRASVPALAWCVEIRGKSVVFSGDTNGVGCGAGAPSKRCGFIYCLQCCSGRSYRV